MHPRRNYTGVHLTSALRSGQITKRREDLAYLANEVRITEVIMSTDVGHATVNLKNPGVCQKSPFLSKEPYLLSKERYRLSKERYRLSEEPHFLSKELCLLSEEPFLLSKEPNLLQIRALSFIKKLLSSIKQHHQLPNDVLLLSTALFPSNKPFVCIKRALYVNENNPLVYFCMCNLYLGHETARI